LVSGASEHLEHGGILRKAYRLRVLIVFINSPLSALFSLLFHLIILGLLYVVYYSNSFKLVSNNCYINIVKQKPVSRRYTEDIGIESVV
jgi:hypothetical protein